jgi:hypothetical protein
MTRPPMHDPWQALRVFGLFAFTACAWLFHSWSFGQCALLCAAAILLTAFFRAPGLRPVERGARQFDLDGVASGSALVQTLTSCNALSRWCRSRLALDAEGLVLTSRLGKRVIPWAAVRHAESEVDHVRIDLADGGALRVPARVATSVAALDANEAVAQSIEDYRRNGDSAYRG